MPRARPLALAAVAAAAVLAAACAEDTEESCPGGRVGTFAFGGVPDADGRETRSAGQLEPGLDPDPALTDCSPATRFPERLPRFGGTLASDGAGEAGALCRSDGPILFGTRTGNRWVVEGTADGAVLGGCDPTCAARLRVVVSGDLVEGPPATFQGALVEQLTFAGGACGACVLPCATRYALSGTTGVP